jgi:hypothetical protein
VRPFILTLEHLAHDRRMTEGVGGVKCRTGVGRGERREASAAGGIGGRAARQHLSFLMPALQTRISMLNRTSQPPHYEKHSNDLRCCTDVRRASSDSDEDTSHSKHSTPGGACCRLLTVPITCQPLRPRYQRFAARCGGSATSRQSSEQVDGQGRG